MFKTITQSIGNGKTTLNYEIIFLGRDILIIIGGGDLHIGSTAIGDQGSVVSYTAVDHRDDSLATPLAIKISKKFNCICTVVAGFHLDSIKENEINEVLDNAERGMAKIINLIQNELKIFNSRL